MPEVIDDKDFIPASRGPLAELPESFGVDARSGPTEALVQTPRGQLLLPSRRVAGWQRGGAGDLIGNTLTDATLTLDGIRIAAEALP